MDRGAWQATVQSCKELNMIEHKHTKKSEKKSFHNFLEPPQRCNSWQRKKINIHQLLKTLWD